MNNFEILQFAIENQKQITAYYDGFYREMCPHTLGFKNGRRQVLCYQFGGESSRGYITTQGSQNWRCMQVDALHDLTIRDGEWHTCDIHTQAQRCVDDITCEIGN
ncbi:hypothetical protein HV096_08185 [Citrobacter freundii]|nr:hypothetical protein [Citrobacter freundii]EJB8473073.1 hypothetical protein [Citrobacter freundii]EJB8558547.1 hypothetical protein [Citrobacter freundii]MBA8032090.1 hypothetical protein [Citrobacter freundii]QLO02579.1 hypothetical protein HV141_02965 [Citrobacter freundii]QLU65204.1 hypothetical protein HV173_02775 [Citrobacter freundii]